MQFIPAKDELLIEWTTTSSLRVRGLAREGKRKRDGKHSQMILVEGDIPVQWSITTIPHPCRLASQCSSCAIIQLTSQRGAITPT